MVEAVKTLKPTSNGSTQQLSYDGSSAWQSVENADSYDLYCTSYTAWQASLFNFSAADIPRSAQIQSVTLSARLWTGASGRATTCLATELDGVYRDHNSVYQAQYDEDILSQVFSTNPAGNPWSRADLDNIVYGISMKRYDGGGSTAYCDWIKVEVSYIFFPLAGGAQIIGLSAW